MEANVSGKGLDSGCVRVVTARWPAVHVGRGARGTPTRTRAGPRSRDVLGRAHSSAPGPDGGRAGRGPFVPGVWPPRSCWCLRTVVTVAVTTAALPRGSFTRWALCEGGGIRFQRPPSSRVRSYGKGSRPTAGVAALSRSWLPWSPS